jgi:hypothetical protein
MTLSPELIETLENIIDKTTLEDVLDALGEICHGKADHIRSNWQDDATAHAWEVVASRIEKAAASAGVRGV